MTNEIKSKKAAPIKPWFVYMIENRLGHYYTGICTDIERRFAEHQASGVKCAKALRGKGPLALKFTCKVDSHSDALKTEIWIKRLSKPNKIKLIHNEFAAAPVKNTRNPIHE